MPGEGKNCLKCGLKGHFRQYCRTRLPIKRQNEMSIHSTDKKKFKRTIPDETDEPRRLKEKWRRFTLCIQNR